MLRVCLVRHAVAEERGPRWPDDRLRPLTAKGIAQWEAGAKGLLTVFEPDLILTSPLVRARQTADILARAANKTRVVEAISLASDDVSEVIEDARRTGMGSVAAVGHEPWLSETLAWAVAPGGAVVEFKKGAAALLRFDLAVGEGAGVLEWFLPPGLLRRLSDPGRSKR